MKVERAMTDLARMTITEVSQDLRTGRISPVELVDRCLKRIEERNPNLNAFITVTAEEAADRAREMEAELKAGKWRGPLHGVPVAVKDFYDTAGIRTTAAFEFFNSRVPSEDAVVVKKLKDAGAIIVGKTNMHTLGMGTTGLESFYGAVRNPWNEEYIPGGSSSGSAAAVASGMCFATVDTDAIGSCRLPAACCGVVGFKGTYGFISSKGILAGEQDPGEMIRWFAHPGVMARSVEDVALMVGVLAEADRFETIKTEQGVRIGVVSNSRADAEIERAFQKAVEVIEGVGFFSASVQAPLSVPTGDLSRIVSDREEIAGNAFGEIDVLMLPTAATVTLSVVSAQGNAQALSAENTIFANYYGLPAVSVPFDKDARGLPLGVQFVGKPGEDAIVLHVAGRFQTAVREGGNLEAN